MIYVRNKNVCLDISIKGARILIIFTRISLWIVEDAVFAVRSPQLLSQLFGGLREKEENSHDNADGAVA